MGLLYQTPTQLNFGDRTKVKQDGSLLLKSMGLPYIFWFYLVAILSVIFGLYIAVDHPLRKLIQTNDPLNMALSYLLYATFILVPFGFTTLYFFEKRFSKKKDLLILTYYFYWIPLYKKTIHLKSNGSFFTRHFIDSPNMARINQKIDTKGFQNNGHFELYAIDKNDREIKIDRSSTRAELEKIKTLLSNY